jgi:hypothetical protein
MKLINTLQMHKLLLYFINPLKIKINPNYA